MLSRRPRLFSTRYMVSIYIFMISPAFFESTTAFVWNLCGFGTIIIFSCNITTLSWGRPLRLGVGYRRNRYSLPLYGNSSWPKDVIITLLFRVFRICTHTHTYTRMRARRYCPRDPFEEYISMHPRRRHRLLQVT